MWNEFKSFLIKQNVIALAIAVVIGTALNAVVKSLVDDFIMPIVAAVLPSGDWQHATWTVGRVHFGKDDLLELISTVQPEIFVGRTCIAVHAGVPAAAIRIDAPAKRHALNPIDRTLAADLPYHESRHSASSTSLILEELERRY